MTSTVTDPIAEALKTIIEGITIAGKPVKTYKWPPQDLDRRPAAVIELPEIRRTEPDTAEDHLAENDWNYVLPVMFYFDLEDVAFSHAAAVETIESFIKAVDADQDLSGNCQEAKVMADRAEYFEGEAKPLIRWPTRVLVLKFVTT